MSSDRSAAGDHAPHHLFERVARGVSKVMGSAAAFAVAIGIVVLWAASGPLFGFSQTWQLVINTGTTIVTFLMVFLLQSTQNRDTTAVHQKLDELIEATKAAHDDLVGLEDAPPEVVERVKRDHARRRSQEEHEEEAAATDRSAS
jgi:low affinity Fe/Cu permease